ncbi:hypothetical protein ACQY0O_006420 [Thecaphora frezii]
MVSTAKRHGRTGDAGCVGRSRRRTLPLQFDDDSDLELKQALQRELKVDSADQRKRKRRTQTLAGSGRLRALLGLGPEDDYIEAGRLSSSSEPDEDEERRGSEQAAQTKKQTKPSSGAHGTSRVGGPLQAAAPIRRREGGENSSETSEEEYVLTVGPKRPRLEAAPALRPGQSPPEAHSPLLPPPPPTPTRRHRTGIAQRPDDAADLRANPKSPSNSDSEDMEYSLTRSQSYCNASTALLPSLTSVTREEADAERPATSSDEDEETVLMLRPLVMQTKAKGTSSASATNATAAPRAERGTAATTTCRGQRPAFSALAEQANVGPLELGEGYCVPASINRFLRDYQREGVKFFFRSYVERRGALLGDDMGLGKTIQVIAFLSAIMQKTGFESDADRRIEAVRSGRQGAGYQKANATWATGLIICPSSVIDNWRDELETWGYFEHAAFTGVKAKAALEAFRRGRLDLLITSHETAAMNIAELESLDLSCVLIDEAHKLKNPGSQMTRAMHRFQCPVRLSLTGTAIQNSYRELYTLADWTNPGLLGTVKEWQREIEDPLKMGQRRDASEEQLADARTRAEKLVQNVLPQFFLRRTKALIQDQLPQKYDKVVFCPLTATQLDVYRRILAEPEVDFMRRHADPCECGAVDPLTDLPFRRQNCCYKRDGAGEAWNKNMLKYIYLLQKCSNHVALVFPDPEDVAAKEPERIERYQRQLSYVQIMFPDDWRDKRCNAANGMNEEYCGKWKVLAGLLAQWRRDGDKVLLFSTNIRLLHFIEFFVSREGHNYCRLDGSTPQGKRQALVHRFNRDPSTFIFLISTTAGGTGLNLTAANKVVVFDPHWNPSHDLQAMDRAYRFGQTRDVNVYRLIGAGSLEECVYGRQIYKQQQMQIGYNATKERRYFEGVAGDKENLGELFGCKNLFKLHETGSETKSIIDECNVAEVTFALERFLDKQLAGEAELSDETLLELAKGAESATQPPGGTPVEGQQADPIKSILDGAGVRYTHLNNEVTGGSRTEARISREAQKAASMMRRSASTSGASKRASAQPASRVQAKAKEKAREPTHGDAAVGAAIWPPPRPKQDTLAKATRSIAPITTQGTSGHVSRSSAAKPSDKDEEHDARGTRRIASLREIARLEGVPEAQLAARIRAMSSGEQHVFFRLSLRHLSRPR